MAPKYNNRDRIAYKEVAARDLILYSAEYVIETSGYRVIRNAQMENDKGCITACSYNANTWESGAMRGHCT